MTTFKKGDIVLYSPIMMPGESSFGGVVRETPWQLGSGDWVTHVIGLGPAYRSFTHRPDKETVHGALLEALEPAPVFFCANDRTWHNESPDKSTWIDAEIFYVMPGTAMALACTTGVGWGYTISTRHSRITERADSYETARAKIEEAFK